MEKKDVQGEILLNENQFFSQQFEREVDRFRLEVEMQATGSKKQIENEALQISAIGGMSMINASANKIGDEKSQQFLIQEINSPNEIGQ